MGVFQYGLSIAESLINHCSDFNYTILYYAEESPKEFLKVKNLEGIKFISLDPSYNSFLGKIKFSFNCLFGRPLFITNKKNEKILKDAKIDLLIIPFQLLLGFENKIPYMVSIPDVMYKFYPQFPEYSFKDRVISNVVFGNAIKYSALAIVDSNCGAEHLQKFFKTPKEKIMSIPYLPAGYVFAFKDMAKETANELLKKYNLPKNFVFYPAQFWAHKNHLNLIKAIKIAEDKYNQKIPLVLVGNDKANSKNYNKIMNLAKDLNLQDRIFHLGYVKDEEIVALYKKTMVLVFASVGGPTNIPIVESMFLGTPVICPNLFAMPEQVGDAGVLFDPFNPEDMAEKIVKVWTDESLRKQMVDKGYEKIKDFNFESYAKMWIMAVKKALGKINKT